MESRKLTKEDLDKVRSVEGFPVAEDEDIIDLSNAPLYTACPNPYVSDFIDEHGRPDVIITDPPRAGMHPDVVETILRAAPKRIVYVSCNPATQARDLERLTEDYHIVIIQPVDMFPHTPHVENVVLLTRKNA